MPKSQSKLELKSDAEESLTKTPATDDSISTKQLKRPKKKRCGRRKKRPERKKYTTPVKMRIHGYKNRICCLCRRKHSVFSLITSNARHHYWKNKSKSEKKNDTSEKSESGGACSEYESSPASLNKNLNVTVAIKKFKNRARKVLARATVPCTRPSINYKIRPGKKSSIPRKLKSAATSKIKKGNKSKMSNYNSALRKKLFIAEDFSETETESLSDTN